MNTIRLLVLTVLMSASAQGGAQYEVKCTHEPCGFATSIGIGGGRKFEQASGFCKKCNQAVSVTWKRDEGKEPVVLSFWDALTGEMRKIFKCSKCKTPYVMIEQIEELKHCPRCGKDALKAKRTMLYD